MSKRLLKMAVMAALLTLGAASVSAQSPNDAVHRYVLFKVLSQSTEAQSQTASDPKAKAYFKAKSELFERKAQEMEQALLPLMREGMAAFQRFLVTDFVLTLVAFQEAHDASQAEGLKTFFLKSLGVSFEALEAEHAKLFSVFGEFLIYKQFRERTDLLLEVGLLSEKSDQKAFDEILASYEEAEFRDLLQTAWDQIQQEKQKRESLFQISGKREIDFSRYATGVLKGEDEEFNYYQTVNHLYPQTKRFFAESLLNRLKELARPEVFVFLKTQIAKETVTDSALSLLIKTTIRALEKKEISLENVNQKILKRADAWSHFMGGPESALVSSAILGLAAQAMVIGAIEGASVLALGPKGVMITVGLTTLFTAAQFGDEYIKDGEFSEEAFLDRFGRNLLVLLPVAAGFQGLAAMTSPLFALGVGVPLMGYQAIVHYERGEYLQMGLSAALAFAGAFQGVRIYRINARTQELALEALQARVNSDELLTVEKMESQWSESPAPEGGMPSPSHTPNTVEEIFFRNPNPKSNPILSQPNSTAPQGSIALMESPAATQLGHAEILPEPIVPKTLPQTNLNISNTGGVVIDPQALPVSPEHIQLILLTLYQNPDPQAENYRIGDLLTNKKDQKKSVVIVRKDPNTGQIVGITIALVSEEEFQRLRNRPYYDVYTTGESSRPDKDLRGLIFPQASSDHGGGDANGNTGVKEEEDLQEIFSWLPSLKSPEEAMLWYSNNFLIRLSGGSFYELSLDEILEKFKAIPASLKTAEHLGFHDVAGIGPFEFSSTESVLEVPAEHEEWFGEMAESLTMWIETYEKKGLGELMLSLEHLPEWVKGLEAFGGAFKKEIEGLNLSELEAMAGESLWKASELSEEEIGRRLEGVSRIYNGLQRKDPNAKILRKVLFALGMMKGVLATEGQAVLASTDASLDEKTRAIIQTLDFLIHHELIETPGERKNRAKLFLSQQARELRSQIQKNLLLRTGDSQSISFLVANGLAGLIRGNFCQSPTCATGRHGQNNQHRNSALSRDNLLLVPVIDGEIRGYIELMRMRIDGEEKPALVLRTCQFEGLTQQGARILLSHLYHQAKAKGYLGIAVPKHMDGKSNLETNKRIIENIAGGGKPITILPWDEQEWETITKSFGSAGGGYYEEGKKDATILIDPKKLIPRDRLEIEVSKTLPAIDEERLGVEKERLKSSESFRLIGLGMGIQAGPFFEAYLNMLSAYGRKAEGRLLGKRESKDFLKQAGSFLKDTGLGEREIDDQLEDLLKSISWKNLATDKKGKDNKAWVERLFKQFVDRLGEERMLRAYQRSMKLRTKVVLEWLPEGWILPLFMRLSGNRLPIMMDFIIDQERTFEVISQIPSSHIASHAEPLLRRYLQKGMPRDVGEWAALRNALDNIPAFEPLKETIFKLYFSSRPSDIALGRDLAYLTTSQKSEEKAFLAELFQKGDAVERQRFPSLLAYQEILRFAQNDELRAAAAFIEDPAQPSDLKAHFLMTLVGVKNSPHNSYFDLLPEHQKGEVNQILDKRGNFNVFLELARQKGVEKEFLEIAKMESFEFEGEFFPKKGKPVTFTMGEEDNARRVTLTRPITFARTAVTQLQYWLVTGQNPSSFKEDGNLSNRPVEHVSYDDATQYAEKLSKLTGDQYRLPTEAEWEYAARGGTRTKFYWGNEEEDSNRYAWSDSNSNNKTHPVAELLPNAYGLYDMSGNVWEWCSNWYGNYPEGSFTDPKGPQSGSHRVYRGGSWYNYPRGLRSADRSLNSPGNRHDYLGFRLLRQ